MASSKHLRRYSLAYLSCIPNPKSPLLGIMWLCAASVISFSVRFVKGMNMVGLGCLLFMGTNIVPCPCPSLFSNSIHG